MIPDKPRILLIQTASIGDVVLASGLLESIQRKWPDARIDFLVKTGMESLFSEHPFLNDVLVWEKKEHKYLNLFRLISHIRRQKYELVINVQRFFSTGLICTLSGGQRIIGFKKNPLSRFFSRAVDHIIGEGIHEIDRNFELLKAIGTFEKQGPRLYPEAKDRLAVESFIQGDYITAAPASLWFTKQFPEEMWVSFLKKVPAHLKIYLLGGKADDTLCSRILMELGEKSVINLAGKLSFLASAELMKQARMNYVNDSAPMHLASAVNATTTAIYCSTVPEFGFGPLAEKSTIIETKKELDCRPCGLHGFKACPQGHFDCARTIDTLELLKGL